MIDAAPSPLPRSRLERIVRGLRQRMGSGAKAMAEEVATLQTQLTQLEAEHARTRQDLEAEFASQQDSSTTAWDETLHQGWDQAELKAYRAVFETASRESQLRKSAKADGEQALAEAKQRVSNAEQRFLKAKNVPLQHLKTFRQSNQRLLQEINELSHQADAALTHYGLRTPQGDQPAAVSPTASDASAALTAFQTEITTARRHYERLAHNRLAKFVESVWWWLLCGVTLLGVTGGLLVSGALTLVPAVLSGCGAAAVLLVGGFLGVRPWLKRIAANEYPKLRQAIDACRALHDCGEEMAVAENDAELKRLAEARDERCDKVKQWCEQQLKKIDKELVRAIENLHQEAKQQKQAAGDELTQHLATTQSRYEQRLQDERQAANTRVKDIREQLERDRTKFSERIEQLERGGAQRLQMASHKAVQIVTRSRRWCAEHFPDWNAFANQLDQWADTVEEPILPIGTLSMSDALPERLKSDLGPAELTAPMLFSPLRDGYLTITADPDKPVVQGLIRNLVMRALTTLPAGKTQVCVVDPPGLGRDFGWLMHLGDFDAQLVHHRVWTQPGHISKQLTALALAAEDFIQQSLRNQYEHIVDYNAEAGALSEPFRLLVWSSLPAGLEDQSWKALQSLLDTGARCGIIPILVIDPKVAWPSPDQLEIIMRRGMHLSCAESSGQLLLQTAGGEHHTIAPYDAADDNAAKSIVSEVGRRALLSSRVEVPLEKMVPPPDQWWQADSSLNLEIPIGQSGVGRTHALRLGVGTAQHAIIAGKTGSGKSSLLHAMITSAIVKYSPDRLRLVLLDFKKGVEFQVYAQARIAHADIIGIESHREFGLSALEYIDACMQRRGEAFRHAGAQDIASWNALHPEQQIPRMLLVIDEFQELFVEDDKLAQQASLILDRIVRQGRSFGVHAVLSSQTLAGSYSLPRTTLGQMAVRIALQCDPSDAQIIFAEDNPAATRLKHPGQAVYNDAGGRIEGNQPMQIGWMNKQTQVGWFDRLAAGYHNDDPTTNRLGRTVVYDGNRAATWDSSNALLALRQAKQEINPDATWCVVGESVAISPAVAFPFTEQAGRNALIVGTDDAQAAAVMNVVTASFAREARIRGQTRASVFVIQGAKPTDAKSLQLPASWKKLDCELSVADTRGADGMLKAVYDQLQSRIEATDGPASAEGDVDPRRPILLNLIQLGRIRSLRRDDEFGLGGFGESEMTPDKHLEELLRDGPNHGIHVLIWAESYSTVNRWLSRSAMREIEIRLLMQMSGNDSTNLVDSIAASRLGDHVMLLFDEATGQEQRFRPFDTETLAELVNWQALLDE